MSSTAGRSDGCDPSDRAGYSVSGSLYGESPAKVLLSALAKFAEAGMTSDDVLRFCEKAVDASGVCGRDDASGGSSLSGISRNSERRIEKYQRKVERDVVSSLKMEQGFAYLAWIRPACVQDVVVRLGAEPSLVSVAALPVDVFVPAVVMGSGATLLRLQRGKLVVDVGRSKGVSLRCSVSFIAAISAELVHASWLPHVEVVSGKAPVACVDKVVSMDVSVGAALEAVVEGYCYLSLFPRELRVLRCAELGRYPLMRRVAASSGWYADAKVSFLGEASWHASGVGGVTWGSVCKVLRSGKGVVCGVPYESLRVHRIGAGENPRERVHSAIRRAVDGQENVVYSSSFVAGHCPVYQGSAEVKPDVVGSIAGSFPGVAVAVLDPGKYLLAGCTELALEVETLVVFNRRVKIKPLFEVPSVYVKVLNSETWEKLCAFTSPQSGFLPRASSSMRLCYQERGSAVLIARHGEPRSSEVQELQGVTLHDPDDTWLAVSNVRYVVSEDKFVKVDSCAGVAVHVEEGEVIVQGMAVMRPGDVRIFTGVGDCLKSVSFAVIKKAVVRVVGIADVYSFDGGGPSGDEDFCSGEEFVEWHG